MTQFSLKKYISLITFQKNLSKSIFLTSIVANWGIYFSFCSFVPNASIIQAHILWIERYAVVEGQAVDNASKITAASTRDNPVPPDSSET